MLGGQFSPRCCLRRSGNEGLPWQTEDPVTVVCNRSNHIFGDLQSLSLVFVTKNLQFLFCQSLHRGSFPICSDFIVAEKEKHLTACSHYGFSKLDRNVTNLLFFEENFYSSTSTVL